MIHDLRENQPGETIKADICIVGAGPAGLCIANEFAGSQRRIVVLESGFIEPDIHTHFLNLARASGPLLDNNPLYLSTSRLRQFGGSQHAWGGWCTSLLGLDFEERSWVPHSGWPISFGELAPYYARAAGIAGVSSEFLSHSGQRLVVGGELAELRFAFAPRNRTVAEVLGPNLVQADNVNVYLGANVVEIERGTNPRRVRHVKALTVPESSPITVAARQVVLAAGGIENARLLLLNELTDSDALGRFFMEHPHVVVGSVQVSASRDVDQFLEQWRPELGHSAMTMLGLPASLQREHSLLNASVQLWPIDPVDEASQSEPFLAHVLLRLEQQPNPRSRVTLGDETDALGCRVVQLDWQLTETDWRSATETTRIVADALERRWSATVDLAPSLGSPWPVLDANQDHFQPWGCHHMGTTRMSDDQGLGVVDANARVFGLENLFVAGSSIFPTGGFANPTLTIMALALRTADHLKMT